MNDGVEYYLIGGNIDTWAIGAARALEQFGLDDKAAIVVCGGNALISEWDSGITSAWKGAIYTPQLIYAEPIFGAVYYMINGWCTAKDLWPDYVTDNTNGYGALLLNSVAITQENYRNFWSGLTGTRDLTGPHTKTTAALNLSFCILRNKHLYLRGAHLRRPFLLHHGRFPSYSPQTAGIIQSFA